MKLSFLLHTLQGTVLAKVLVTALAPVLLAPVLLAPALVPVLMTVPG